MNKEKNYITPRGMKRLQDEHYQLSHVERPEVTKTVAWAASNGDRSENADYIYGKKRMREIDRRVRFLSARIDAAVVVDPTKIKSEKVQFGATVKISDVETDEEKIISIVGVDEIDTEKNQISWKSPLGSALIGKEVGDTIVFKIPVGTKTYEILDIVYSEIQ
ncbi:MAG: transcription elongation factor GreB [Bdellovibrionales bacterium]|nr:transcription elongation factor GreB [Bdellovibrionales bacterium]